MVEKVPPTVKSPATLNSSLLSSPPRAPPARGAKERRNPSITPRKFKKFFTPRSRVSTKPSAVRKALHDLTAPALNRCLTPSSPLKCEEQEPVATIQLPSLDNGDDDLRRVSKRQKVCHTPEPAVRQLLSPLATSPVLPKTPEFRPSLLSPLHGCHESLDPLDSDDDLPPIPVVEPLKVPVPLHRRGFEGQLLQRMTGGAPRTGHQYISRPVSDWRTETADFYSTVEDMHLCTSHEDASQCIPFCTAACHTNDLVAVGDEEGRVRLLDSSGPFSKIHLSFQAHGNAIIDLAFSEDDYLLATASGDQTGKVFDMMTQTPVSVLGQHTASLKQVRFQPGRGSKSVLATSSRDGSVQIWDLRCRGGPVQHVAIERESRLRYGLSRQQANAGCAVNSIYDAHARIAQRQTRQQQQKQAVGALGTLMDSAMDVVRTTGEVPGRVGEVSVTALQFLPPGREHLLLTGCDADARIKLWDVRSVHSSGAGTGSGARHHKSSSMPVSATAVPASHAAWRPFGISALALGGDGARLYAACKDNTVYAYSTAHLVLGHASDLMNGAGRPRNYYNYSHHGHLGACGVGAAHEGLGPLYGFRHQLFHATSFYVKCAVRPTRNGRPEMLAVGSSDGCAVLFPTDERYFLSDRSQPTRNAIATGDPLSSSSFLSSSSSASSFPRPPSRRPALSRANSMGIGPGTASQFADDVPIVRQGTPLVRGHDKEVGALAWTSGSGSLITVGDDYLVRRWREAPAAAADLRTGGEGGGRRWASGWADVGEGWEGMPMIDRSLSATVTDVTTAGITVLVASSSFIGIWK